MKLPDEGQAENSHEVGIGIGELYLAQQIQQVIHDVLPAMIAPVVPRPPEKRKEKDA
jgi:hypothetical protein